MKQGTKAWLDHRKGFLGASDAPVVMNVSPWKTPFELWEEKMGLKPDGPDNFAMRYGREMEEPARQAYEKHTNNLIAPEVIYHPTRKYMMASLDGLSLNGDLIVEIKNANKVDHQLAKDGKVPDKYYPQLQHQLDCLPGSILHYWSFHNGEGALVEIERNDEYITDLVTEEERFWKGVICFEAPELTERDYLDLSNDEEWSRITNEARVITELEKEITARKEENRLALKQKCQGRSARGNGVQFTRSFPKGRVDYNSIPELAGIDLTPYRKPSAERWSMSIKIEKE